MSVFLRSIMILLFLILTGFEGFTTVGSDRELPINCVNNHSWFESYSQKWNQGLPSNFFLANDHQRVNAFNGHSSPSGRQTDFNPDTILLYSLGDNPLRYTYLYNNNGKLLITFVKEFVNSQWVNVAMENKTWDNQGNELVSLWQTWQGGNWTNNLKTTTTYVNNQAETVTTQIWSAGQWLNQKRVTNTYDVAFNLVSRFTEVWGAGSWNNSAIELFQYDDNNNLLNQTGQVWNAVYWLNDYQVEFTYNGNNKLATAEFRQWFADAWLNNYREEYVYDNLQNLIQYTGKIWLGNGWIFADKYAYTYVPEGWVETASYQQWQTNQWINSQKSNFVYHGFGGIQSALYQQWTANQWANDGLTNCSYDSDGNASQCAFFNWNGTTWEQNENAVLELTYSNGVKIKRLSGYEARASYVSYLVGQNEVNRTNNITLSPNPATDHLNIVVNEAIDYQWRIYSVSGQLLLEGRHNSAHSINLTSFENGLYILSVNYGRENINQKFIKK